MRCPKCSFISFDMVESCTKCGKDISSTAKDIKGTIANVEAPAFLRLDFEEYEESAGFEETAGGEEEEMVMDLEAAEEEEAEEFVLGEEGEAEEGEADFAVEAEAAEEEEFALAQEEEEEEAISISDLAPEEEPLREAEQEFEEEKFELETEPAVEEDVPAEGKGARELEDLEVEGIDLAGSSAPRSGKVMPSVKTGTALDDFDIDLGDLITAKKKED